MSAPPTSNFVGLRPPEAISAERSNDSERVATSDARRAANYVIISPVKDEERYVETTIQAVCRQTVLPLKWIIVDDGSQDRTGSILRRYAGRFEWITVLSRSGSQRRPGAGVVRAFQAGYELACNRGVDLLVKLDCDLDFANDYFERLIIEFNADPLLGIASGGLVEVEGQKYRLVDMPEYHAHGASKMVRVTCFREIGEFVPSLGWDFLDEVRARMGGWKTGHFDLVPFYHLKKPGAGIGTARWTLKVGEIDYLMGIAKSDLAIKILYRLFCGQPVVAEGGLLLLGYLRAWIQRKPRLVNDEETRFYRKMRAGHLKRKMREAFRRLSRPIWALRPRHSSRSAI